jgi:hypothetical protein
METKISISISADAITAIGKDIADIKTKLPGLINLTQDDRHSLPKMGDKTLAFVNKALEYAGQNPNILPQYFDLTEFAADVQAVKDLTSALVPVQQLEEEIDDTLLLCGSEAYTAALVFYNAVKSAAKANVPGMKAIFDDMQARFPGRGKTATTTTTVTADK